MTENIMDFIHNLIKKYISYICIDIQFILDDHFTTCDDVPRSCVKDWPPLTCQYTMQYYIPHMNVRVKIKKIPIYARPIIFIHHHSFVIILIWHTLFPPHSLCSSFKNKAHIYCMCGNINIAHGMCESLSSTYIFFYSRVSF